MQNLACSQHQIHTQCIHVSSHKLKVPQDIHTINLQTASTHHSRLFFCSDTFVSVHTARNSYKTKIVWSVALQTFLHATCVSVVFVCFFCVSWPCEWDHAYLFCFDHFCVCIQSYEKWRTQTNKIVWSVKLQPFINNNNNSILNSSQWEIEAVIQSHSEEHISIILSCEAHAHTHS